MTKTAYAADPVVQNDGDTKKVTTATYEAVVDTGGALSSLTVGGQQFFSAAAVIPRGLYIYQKGILKLDQITQKGDNVLTAQNDRASLRYEFGQDSITITATNLTGEPMPYYAAFDKAVSAFINNAGQTVKTVASQNEQNTTTWFREKAKLKIEGGSNVFGPWGPNNLQIWQATVAPDDTVKVVLTPGTATPEELQKIAQP